VEEKENATFEEKKKEDATKIKIIAVNFCFFWIYQ